MKCPNCGNEIKEGHVYCDSCGHDIQIVPSFDAEVEIEMDQTLAGILDGINLEELTEDELKKLTQTMDIDMTKELYRQIELAHTRDLSDVSAEIKKKYGLEETKEQSQDDNKKSMLRRIFVALAMFFSIAVVIGCIALYSHMHSVEYYMNKAEEALLSHEYKAAVSLYEKVYEKEPENRDCLFGMAVALRMSGYMERAEEILLGLYDSEPTKEVCGELIAIYEDAGDYGLIASILSRLDAGVAAENFGEYIANPPSFDQPEGNYTDSLTLKIMTDMPGHIFYTLDGSEPSVNSDEYITPITLGAGKNVIRAVFVNERGIVSDSVVGIYEIISTLPSNPELSLETGEYYTPQYVEVTVPEGCKVYYTENGTMPDEASILYSYPILLKLGNNRYKFVAIDELGKRSDIVSVEYTLNIPTNCRVEEALNYVYASFTALGKLLSTDGTGADGLKYKFECIGVASINGDNLYIIEENISHNNKKEPTGKYYAVSSVTGILYNAGRDSNSGKFWIKGFTI